MVFATGLPPGPYEIYVGFPLEEDSCFIDAGYDNPPFSTGVNSSGPRSTIFQPNCLMRLGIGKPQSLTVISNANIWIWIRISKFYMDFFALATDFFCLVEVPLFLSQILIKRGPGLKPHPHPILEGIKFAPYGSFF